MRTGIRGPDAASPPWPEFEPRSLPIGDCRSGAERRRIVSSAATAPRVVPAVFFECRRTDAIEHRHAGHSIIGGAHRIDNAEQSRTSRLPSMPDAIEPGCGPDLTG